VEARLQLPEESERDAEMAVKRSSGVDEFSDKIAVQPASINDDRIRWASPESPRKYGETFHVSVDARFPASLNSHQPCRFGKHSSNGIAISHATL